MELQAAIAALHRVPPDLPVVIYSDSRYVVDGIRLYLPAWQAGGWRNRSGKPVKNRDLWQALQAACPPHVSW